jgi:glycosyltransferase involved in cell wall biosynthesis
MTGYPPFKLGIPFVFDYLDLVDWDNHPSKPDLPYLQNAKAVLGVSERTYRRAQRHGTEAYFLPNGADIGWLREADGHTVRDRHDLREATIVSLIGLSVGEGEGTYFIDAVEKAKQRVPSLHCLLVGDSPLLKNLVRSRDPAGETFTYVGKVDYEEVAEYYAASDIGLYPAPGSTHDDGRSPIKIFEYSAQGTPVVAAPIQEVKRMSFENVILADPSPQSFAKGIWKATQKGKTKAEGIDEYDWGVLARKVEEILQTTRTEKTPVGHKGK